MKTIIYELLGMIKDGKAPKKIMVFDEVFEYSYDKKDYEDGSMYWLFDDYEWKNELNTEVEILETTITITPKEDFFNNLEKTLNQDKIEKLSLEQIGLHYLQKWEWKDFVEQLNKNFHRINLKINEIIDKLNGG